MHASLQGGLFASAIAASLALIAVRADAAIPLAEIRGLNQVTAAYDELNPLHGLVWDQSEIIANYGELMDDKDPIRKVVVALFLRNGPYVPSQLPSVKIFTPHMIGTWLGVIETCVAANTDKARCRALLEAKTHSALIAEIDKASLRPTQQAHEMKQLSALADRSWDLRHDSRLYRAFLALLWSEATTKSDFVEYYRGLHDTWREHAPQLLELAFIASPRTLFASSPERDKFLRATFSAADVDPNAPIDPYDAFLFSFFGDKANSIALLNYGRVVSAKNHVDWSDCGENSLRNLLRLVLAGRDLFPYSDGYNLAVLGRLGATDELMHYFAKFATAESQTTPEARNEWGELLSNRMSDGYGQVSREGYRYNLSGSLGSESQRGAANMLALIRTLFSREFSDWDSFAKEVDAARQSFDPTSSFELNVSALKDNFGSMPFTVNTANYVWEFQSRHFFIKPRLNAGSGSAVDAVPSIGLFDGDFKRGQSARLRATELWSFSRMRSQASAQEKAHLKTLVPYVHLEGDDGMVNYLVRLRELGDRSDAAAVGLINRLTLDDARTRALEYLVSDPAMLSAVLENSKLISHPKMMWWAVAKEMWKEAFALSRRKEIQQPGLSQFLFYKGKEYDPSKPSYAVFSPDGMKLLVLLDKLGDTRIWDMARPEVAPLVLNVGFADMGFPGLQFSTDGSKVISYDSQGTPLQVWDLAHPEAKPVDSLDVDRDAYKYPHSGPTHVEFDFDTCEVPGSCVLEESKNRQVTRRIAMPGCSNHDFFPLENADATKLMTTLRLGHGGADVRIFDFHHPEAPQAVVPLNPSVYSLTRGLAFSPDGTKIVTSQEPNALRVWDLTKLARPHSPPVQQH